MGRVVQHRLDPGNWRAEHASDDAKLLADRRLAGLGEDGAMVAATISAEPLGT